MRFTRLFAPFAVAAALIAPASVPAANALPADSRMAVLHGEQQGATFQPVATIAGKANSLIVTSVTLAHTIKVRVYSRTDATFQQIKEIQPRESAAFAPWQQIGAPLGAYGVEALKTTGERIEPQIEGTVEVIDR